MRYKENQAEITTPKMMKSEQTNELAQLEKDSKQPVQTRKDSVDADPLKDILSNAEAQVVRDQNPMTLTNKTPRLKHQLQKMMV